MKQFTLFLIGVVAIALSSCGGSGGGYSNSSPQSSGSSSPSGTGAIAVTPSGPSAVAAGSTTNFTASIQNTSNTAVTWQVNGTPGGNSTVGTISASGSFTAPNIPPAGGSVTITAVSQADSTKSGSITVTIQFSNASVQGVYAFSVSGTTGGSNVSAVGSFQANGSGTITNGAEDFNGSAGTFASLAFTGSYSIGADGRGSATVMSTLGTTVYRLVVVATGQVQLIGFDSGDSISGSALPQNSNELNLNALAGNWSFFLAGSSGGTTVVDAGRFTLDSLGNITLGAEDQNSGGTVSLNATFAGTASSVSPNGRGTATFAGTLGTSNFTFYVVSANAVSFVETDSGVFLSGFAYKHQSASFDNSSLNGTYVFLLAGADGSGNAAAEIGEITAGGNGLFTGGIFDQNDNGTTALNQAITGGNYSVSANGRGTASVTSTTGTSTYAFYFVSPSLVVFVETDSFAEVVGLANLQSGAPFSNSSLSGSFAFASFGVASGGGFESIGHVTANGSGSLTGGVEDIAQGGTVVSGVAFSGSYSFASNGRGTVQLTGSGGTANLIFYIFNSSVIDYLEIDPSEVVTGLAAKQF